MHKRKRNNITIKKVGWVFLGVGGGGGGGSSSPKKKHNLFISVFPKQATMHGLLNDGKSFINFLDKTKIATTNKNKEEEYKKLQ